MYKGASDANVSLWFAAKRPIKALKKKKEIRSLHYMHVYAETHTHRLPCQHTVKVCRGEAGFREKTEKKRLSYMTSPARKPPSMNPHTDTQLIDLSSVLIPDVKPQVTNDSVPSTARKPQVRTH